MGNMGYLKGVWLAAACGFITACGGEGGAGSISLPVDAGNSLPQISGVPFRTASVGQLYQFTPSATDADGETLTFRIENRPDWATFSPSTGRLEGTPPSTARPVYERILISVTDGQGFSELPAFDITVQGLAPAANTAPTISGTPAASIVAGNAYEFIPQAVDPDGQALTLLGERPADLDRIRLADRSHLGNTSRRGCRHAWWHRDLGLGRRRKCVAGYVQHRGYGRRESWTEQSTAGHQRNAAGLWHGRPSLQLHADGLGSGRTGTDVLDCQSAVLGKLQHLNGPPERHAGRGQRRLVHECLDFRFGRRGAGVARAVHDRGRSRGGRQSTAGHQRNPAGLWRGRPSLQLHADGLGSGRAGTDVLDCQSTVLGTFNTSTGRLSGTPTAANVGSYTNVSITVSDGAAQASLAPFTIVVAAAAVANRPPVISGRHRPLAGRQPTASRRRPRIRTDRH